jgi:nicotinamidase/pyrazinamidase
MSRALFVIDVQNDFCEGGALACQGGALVAKKITEYLNENPGKYDHVIASRDWHTKDDRNDGHFPEQGEEPDFVKTWPLHCIADTHGAEYHPNLDSSLIDIHIKKGQGQNGYSIFDGTTDSGEKLDELISRLGITEVDVVGIATDYCVRASAIDANTNGSAVKVITGLTAGVSDTSIERAIDEMVDLGITVTATA